MIVGSISEINTLIRLPRDFDCNGLEVNKSYSISKDRNRIYPVGIAILIVDSDWNFYGYGKITSSNIHKDHTEIEFSVLSVFSTEEAAVFKDKFLEAAHQTGEI